MTLVVGAWVCYAFEGISRLLLAAFMMIFVRRRNMQMQPRLDYGAIVAGVGRAMSGLDQLVRPSHLASQEPLLIELVKIRASQINGCAY